MNNINTEKLDDWNKNKKVLARKNSHLFFENSEIWWCHLGMNLGFETYGKGLNFRRPVLILKKLSNFGCICIPITSKSKTGSWYYEIIFNGEKRWLLLNQIRMISSKRLQRNMGNIGERQFSAAKEKLKVLLELF